MTKTPARPIGLSSDGQYGEDRPIWHMSSVHLRSVCSCLEPREDHFCNFGRTCRTTKVITLQFHASLCAQDIKLFLGLNSFGRRRLAEADGKSNHRTRD